MATGDTPLVSAVIVTHQSEMTIGACLESLRRQTVAFHEVVVVDSASTDGSVGAVRRVPLVVRLTASSHNLGFAAACNLGARQATGTHLAFLNPDVVLADDWLAQIRAVLPADMVASQVRSIAHPNRVESLGDTWTPCGIPVHRRQGVSVDAVSVGAQPVLGAAGCAMVVDRQWFARLGGFDEDLFCLHEDSDFNLRAARAGARCLLAPRAVVYHHGSTSIGRLSEFYVWYGQRNLEWAYLRALPRGALLTCLPGHLLYECGAGVYFLRQGRLRTFLSAKWAALVGAGHFWRKRRRDLESVGWRRLRSMCDEPCFAGRWAQKVRAR